MSSIQPVAYIHQGNCDAVRQAIEQERAKFRKVLEAILDEPNETMSNGKALAEIMRLVKLSLKEIS